MSISHRSRPKKQNSIKWHHFGSRVAAACYCHATNFWSFPCDLVIVHPQHLSFFSILKSECMKQNTKRYYRRRYCLFLIIESKAWEKLPVCRTVVLLKSGQSNAQVRIKREYSTAPVQFWIPLRVCGTGCKLQSANNIQPNWVNWSTSGMKHGWKKSLIQCAKLVITQTVLNLLLKQKEVLPLLPKKKKVIIASV